MLRYYANRGYISTKRKRGRNFSHEWSSGLQPLAAPSPIKTSGNVSKLFQKTMEILQYKTRPSGHLELRWALRIPKDIL